MRGEKRKRQADLGRQRTRCRNMQTEKQRRRYGAVR